MASTTGLLVRGFELSVLGMPSDSVSAMHASSHVWASPVAAERSLDFGGAEAMSVARKSGLDSRTSRWERAIDGGKLVLSAGQWYSVTERRCRIHELRVAESVMACEIVISQGFIGGRASDAPSGNFFGYGALGYRFAIANIGVAYGGYGIGFGGYGAYNTRYIGPTEPYGNPSATNANYVSGPPSAPRNPWTNQGSYGRTIYASASFGANTSYGNVAFWNTTGDRDSAAGTGGYLELASSAMPVRTKGGSDRIGEVFPRIKRRI
ncbi:hypothetical protein NE237_020102 [Protea cynaroides]|uniref:Uncharacterized protein n=1 Tax=Protea cynaroides TaxID=273540 RepID=A0A9Q0H9X0_9MAGN|nr:hypothetical protein NE237_020102 [Protea cynaroides]